MDIPAARAALRKIIAVHEKHLALPPGQAASAASSRQEMALIQQAAAALGIKADMADMADSKKPRPSKKAGAPKRR